jgi:hypothetical protein
VAASGRLQWFEGLSIKQAKVIIRSNCRECGVSASGERIQVRIFRSGQFGACNAFRHLETVLEARMVDWRDDSLKQLSLAGAIVASSRLLGAVGLTVGDAAHSNKLSPCLDLKRTKK